MKNSKGISSIFIALCLLFILSLFFINSWFLSKLFGDFHPYYSNNIKKVQWMIVGYAILIGGIGWLGLKKNIFDFANRKPRTGNFILLLVFLCSVLWFTEGLLRIKPLLTTQQLYDSSIPYENAIFARNRLPQESKKIPYPYLPNKTNYKLNKGYHGPNFSYNKPAGETRIVMLGGSFVFGDHSDLSWDAIESEYNRNWVLKTQQKLKAKGHHNVRIVNAGIPGHTTFDSFGRLYSEIHMLSPDYIVLCHGWNDIEYFADVKPENSLLRIMNPKRISNRNEVSDFFEYSQLYLRIKRYFQFEDLGVEGVKHKPEKGLTISQHAVKQFQLNLDLFIYTCKLINAQPILLTQPRLINENNSTEQRKKIGYSFQRLAHNEICESYKIIDSLIINASIKDSTVISYDFAKPYIGVDSLFVDHVHLNQIGNEVMSSDLSNYFDSVLTQQY